MEKSLNINAGAALILKDQSDVFSGYETASINAGNAVISRTMYDKMIQMGVNINCGRMDIIDACGEIVELASGTVITDSMSFNGCYLLCEGKLVIESISGLSDITGMYVNKILHLDSIDLSTIKGITAVRRVAYPDGAKIILKSMTLDEESAIAMDSKTYFVDGTVTATDSKAVEMLFEKNIKLICSKLIIHTGIYEKFKDMFKAERFVLVPDDHAFVDDLTLDAATSIIYGEKLFILGDLMIQHNQAQHLQGFSSIIVKGTVTMPVTAAKDFKACGKADEYDIYEGALVTVNGNETYSHEQLQEALRLGLSYTIKINGNVAFLEDVTAEDVEAIAAIDCNGCLYAPGSARSALDSKIRSMNGEVLDIALYNTGESESEKSKNETNINIGVYKQI